MVLQKQRGFFFRSFESDRRWTEVSCFPFHWKSLCNCVLAWVFVTILFRSLLCFVNCIDDLTVVGLSGKLYCHLHILSSYFYLFTYVPRYQSRLYIDLTLFRFSHGIYKATNIMYLSYHCDQEEKGALLITTLLIRTITYFYILQFFIAVPSVYRDYLRITTQK